MSLMRQFHRVVDVICHPKRVLLWFWKHTNFMYSDKVYLKGMYWLHLGKRLDLKNPQTFTAKLQWLKLYDRKPLYTQIVDKYAVKQYVADIIGEKYIIPTLEVWDSVDKIDYSVLPEQFVLKTTHGGGGSGVAICRDKKTFSTKKAAIILEQSMKSDLYKLLREWPYKNVPKRIIAEKYMEDDSGELRDYKFYCFNGEPKAMLIASNRFTNHNFNYFDMDFKKLPIVSAVGKQSTEEFKKPAEFEEMKEIAKQLSKGFPHVRVDLYCCNHQVYFGELTFFDASGYDDMSSEEWDLKFGSWIKLPR